MRSVDRLFYYSEYYFFQIVLHIFLNSSLFTIIVEDVIVLALVVDLVFFVDVVGVGSGVLAK